MKPKSKLKNRPPKIESHTKGDILDRIKPLGYGGNDYIKLLLYGESNTGKTTFWSTFKEKILAITVKTGKGEPEEFRSIRTAENRKRISTFAIEHSSELPELLDRIGDDYETVVLDHVSGFQDLVLKEILGLDEIPEQKNWGLAQQQDYGECTLMCKVLLRRMLNHPKNVVFIAHQRVFGNEEGGSSELPMMIGAELMPKLARWLNGQVSYIGQMFRRQKEVIKKVTKKKNGKLITKERRLPGKGTDYCLRIGDESHVYMTKFRKPRQYGSVPDLIVDPDYNKLLKLIKEKRSDNQQDEDNDDE